MAAKRTSDEEFAARLRAYDEECASGKHRSYRQAAIAAAARCNTSQGRLNQQLAERNILNPPLVKPAPEMVMKGVSTLFKDGVEVGRWDKTKQRGRPDDEVVHLPDPKTISKISTNYDQMGEVTQQWVSERPADVARLAAWQEYARALAETLPRAEPIPLPEVDGSRQLMACYPIGDHHLGMLSWKHETGESYDIEIGERLLTDAMRHLVKLAPRCEQAAVVFLGDFMHYDSFESVTPTSRNLLDADGRYPKMASATVRTMRTVIEAAAAYHGHVRVIMEIGNHDTSSMPLLAICFANIYENDPRITIDTSPRHFHYFEFGKCLVGTHHGDMVKPAQLPGVMAEDQYEAWGRTRHRMWLTGHIHQRTAYDFPGCTVESYRILPPPDAWGANRGYRPHRDMKVLILHHEHGEVARYSVSPSMLDARAAA